MLGRSRFFRTVRCLCTLAGRSRAACFVFRELGSVDGLSCRPGIFDRRDRLSGRRCRQCSYGGVAEHVATAAVGVSTSVRVRARRDRTGANGRQRDFRDRSTEPGTTARSHWIGSRDRGSRRRIDRNMRDRAFSSHLLDRNGTEKIGHNVVSCNRTNDPDRKAANCRR